jgi:hypothetical protein
MLENKFTIILNFVIQKIDFGRCVEFAGGSQIFVIIPKVLPLIKEQNNPVSHD